MKVLNFANDGRIVYTFCRDEKGVQTITKDTEFYPFFYEKDNNGDFNGYDGSKLRKVICNSPNEIPQMRTFNSYCSDVRYLVNYAVHKVDKFEKTKLKYFFIDIEILTPELPDLKEAKYPVSCITVYNSLSKEYLTFFLNDYPGKTVEAKEKHLLEEFMHYMKLEAPDLWLSWNVTFDYQYLHNRIKNFAKKISPIDRSRASKEKDIYFPSGISILDYLTMFKKVNMRESSMKLDNIAEKYLGAGKVNKEVDFMLLDETLRERNKEDVELLVKLEEKFRIIEYFDEIRIFAKCLWEDLTHNSLILDSVVLEEARKRNVVLPTRMDMDTREDEELVGAYRRSDSGVFFDIYKADVASMYPNQLVNFCLDSANIVEQEVKDFQCIKIQDTLFKQDKNAILPHLATKLMNIKDDLKVQLKEMKLGSEESKVLQMKYDAYKGLVNSLFGVTAFPSFRLYNNAVASAITFLARDLLHYTEDAMIELGSKVVAVDTDALMYSAEKDEIDYLNSLVHKWAKDVYNKDNVNIRFESEGVFTKLLILGKCHYYGYIKSEKGIKKEIKGVEVKRSSSSKYESYFQENLIEKVLDKKSRNEIIAWIKAEKDRIRTLPIFDIAFPCKMSNKKYVSTPIFVRAYNNTKNIKPKFNLTSGESYYYAYIRSLGKDNNGKDINVLAFTKEEHDFIDRARIDWNEHIRRNIESKSEAIFEAIGWTSTKNEAMALF